MVNSMNSFYHGPNHWKGPIIKNMFEIRRPGERFVFTDEGKVIKYAWAVEHKKADWRDQPPVQHGNGATFSFADGHSEYWKWEDPRTIEIAEMDYDYWQSTGRHGSISTQPGNPDLHRVQKAVWGELGYTVSPW